MFNIFSSNIVIRLKNRAPSKTVYIFNDKPKINLKDDNFISKVLNAKTIERQKCNIVKDTRNSKNSSNKIELLKDSYGETITNKFKVVNLPNYISSRLGCILRKKCKQCR